MDQKELLEKIKAAKSAEEIIEISKETGKEIPAEEAKRLYDELRKPEELSDEDLDAVAGGWRQGQLDSIRKILEEYNAMS